MSGSWLDPVINSFVYQVLIEVNQLPVTARKKNHSDPQTAPF
jgi:hypothetical protein